ncbi:MazG-like family protein [Streptomyces sp. DH24]|uniref:MazG-like family protein n=1 Tax=Streptomyces sp. DH24 TaxID=3040123 RepID=UPI0024432432|nr:MazG-like family protein [Streptomyces sp. DH24]MDG9716074.1 MazG-like family protein [Streptomyces sp. DH24]
MTDHETTQTAPTPAPAPATDDLDLWSTVDELWTWLDSHRTHEGREGLVLRMLKLSEEVGEVAQAVIGATGQNPRKGVTHTWDDVQAELCDVIFAALVALRTLTPDAREVFAHHLARVRNRSLTNADSPRPLDG